MRMMSKCCLSFSESFIGMSVIRSFPSMKLETASSNQADSTAKYGTVTTVKCKPSFEKVTLSVDAAPSLPTSFKTVMRTRETRAELNREYENLTSGSLTSSAVVEVDDSGTQKLLLDVEVESHTSE